MAPGKRALSSLMASLSNGPSRSSTPNTPLVRPEDDLSRPVSGESLTSPQQQQLAQQEIRQQSFERNSPSPPNEYRRRSSRPLSMIQPFTPPIMEVNKETIPELQPIFTFLNSHSNKLYQEGYFLKLHDRDPSGRPTVNRTWTECFAQLVGTVLSLWDASSLDAAGGESEVIPTFINLSDASIKLIESLATRSPNAPPLQNVLSVSTAGNNLYLFHFSSHHALVQWAAAIRLAMFEQSCLQEAYTGSLIAGKGRDLVGIKDIMQYTKFKTEDWVRVRFGAGTPWRRCWCVISPPDEKQVAKERKQARKTAYSRGPLPYSKGNIKFYETKKTKKITPIATIENAYSAYALYPQSKHLVEQSTLVKIEGQVTIHAKAPTTSDGIVFVMPEGHPGIAGIETMIRFLFRAFDVFALYGRPGRLVAEPLDVRSLMFAMPRSPQYGYLHIIDVVGLINERESRMWTDSEWRKQLKSLTAKRVAAIRSGDNPRMSLQRKRSSLPTRTAVKFDGVTDDDAIIHDYAPPQRPATAIAPITRPPPSAIAAAAAVAAIAAHSDPELVRTGQRFDERPAPPAHRGSRRYSSSEVHFASQQRSGSAPPQGAAPAVPAHGPQARDYRANSHASLSSNGSRPAGSRSSTESTSAAIATHDPAMLEETAKQMRTPSPNGPVAAPPSFTYAPGAKPSNPPRPALAASQEQNRISDDTLAQLATAGGFDAAAGAVASWRENRDQQQVARIGAVSRSRASSVSRSRSRSRSPEQAPAVPAHVAVPAEEVPPPVPVHRAVPSSQSVAPPPPETPIAFNNVSAPPSTPQAPAHAAPTYQEATQQQQTLPPPIPPNHHVAYPSPAMPVVAAASPQHQPPPVPQHGRRFSFEMDSPENTSHGPTQSALGQYPTAPTNTPTVASMASAAPRVNGRNSISRKPVPQPSLTPAVQTPLTSTSMRDLQTHLLDEDAMSRIVPMRSHPALARQDGLARPLDNMPAGNMPVSGLERVY